MDNGAGYPPPSAGPERAGDAGAEGPPPIPLAPEGPRQSYGPHAGYGYGQTPGAVPGPYGGPPGYAAGGGSGYAAYGAGAYGSPASHGYGWSGPPLPAGLSIAAMVLGIVSVVLVVTCWGSFLGVITSTIALCLSVSARRKVARGVLGGRGQATAGFVLGIVGLVGSVVVSALLVLALTVWSDESGPGRDRGRDSYDARGAVASPQGAAGTWKSGAW